MAALVDSTAGRHALITDQRHNKLSSLNLETGAIDNELQLELISYRGAIAMNPSGTIVLLAEKENSLQAIEIATLEIISTISCGGDVRCVAWSADGKYIAAGLTFMRAGKVALIKPSAYWTAKPVESHTAGIVSVNFSPSSTLLVSTSDDRKAVIYMVGDDQLTILHVLKGHTGGVLCSIFLDNDRVATGSEDSTIRVWSTATGKILRKTAEQTWGYRAFALSPDGNWLATGERNKFLRLYDAKTLRCINNIVCADEPCAISFLDNSTLIAVIRDSEVLIVDVPSLSVKVEYKGEHDWPSIVVCNLLFCCKYEIALIMDHAGHSRTQRRCQ